MGQGKIFGAELNLTQAIMLQIAIADLHIIEEWTVVIGGVLQVPF